VEPEAARRRGGIGEAARVGGRAGAYGRSQERSRAGRRKKVEEEGRKKEEEADWWAPQLTGGVQN